MSTLYEPTHVAVDYTSEFVTADPNERVSVFYPVAGPDGWAQYGWTDGYPVLLWVQNAGFTSGSLPDTIGPLSSNYAILERGIAVAFATTVQAENQASGGPIGAGTFRPPAFAGNGNSFDQWDDPTFANTYKSGVHLIQWARSEAATYGFDPDRIAIGGRSGGSHAPLFVGHGLDWSTYAGASGQFRDGVSTRPNAVLVMQTQAWWDAFPDSTLISILPDATNPLTTIAPNKGSSTVALVRESSPIWYCFSEDTYPGVRANTLATPIYMWATDDLGSTDFTVAGNGLPTLSQAITASHDGWHTAIYWRRLLELGEDFHSVNSRAVWLNKDAPGTTLVPFSTSFETNDEVYQDAADWLLGAIGAQPAQEPASERILADLAATIRGIKSGSDFFTTFRKSVVGDAAGIDAVETPAAYIRATRTDMDGEGQTLTNAIRHEMFADVTLAIESRTDLTTKLERAIADVTRALYQDRSRGGVAVHTIVEAVDRSYPDGTQQDVAIATLQLRIPFRTTTSDLGSTF